MSSDNENLSQSKYWILTTGVWVNTLFDHSTVNVFLVSDLDIRVTKLFVTDAAEIISQ